MPPYTPLRIANYFIEKSFATGVQLTPMKLVKLVYISHGWHLAITDTPLISEQIQAWKYGPVINSIYHTFKKYGSKNITEMELDGFYPTEIDANTKQLLDKVWEVYSKYDAIKLSSLTHQVDTPWDIVWNKQNGKINPEAPIPNDLIKLHYINLNGNTAAANTTNTQNN